MFWLAFSFQKSATETLRHRDNLTVLNVPVSRFVFMLRVSVPLWPLFQTHRHSRVLVIHLRVLTQQLFRLFRNYFRQSHLHFDELITARARAGSARHDRADETSGLTAFPAECAIALCR